MWKFYKHFSHLITTFTTANVYYNFGICPFCNLMQCDGLSCSKTPWYSTSSTFCNWEVCINYTLPCNERHRWIVPFCIRPWPSNWPFMIHLQFIFITILFCTGNYAFNVIITFSYYIGNLTAVVIRWNQNTMGQ